MPNMMAVLLNGVAQLEYDRGIPLTDYQQTYLSNMDSKMNEGIEIDGKRVKKPDVNEKAQFVVANLLNAMKTDNEGMTSALCTYLADRMPDLKQLKITEDNTDVSIEFVFDEEYGKQTFVEFTKH